MQVVAADWDSLYVAANNQLAAWKGWSAKDSVMFPETADGGALHLYGIEHVQRLVAPESSPTATGDTAVLPETPEVPQPQVDVAFFRLLSRPSPLPPV